LGEVRRVNNPQDHDVRFKRCLTSLDTVFYRLARFYLIDSLLSLSDASEGPTINLQEVISILYTCSVCDTVGNNVSDKEPRASFVQWSPRALIVPRRFDEHDVEEIDDAWCQHS